MRKIVLFCASLCTVLLLISASPVRAQTLAWVSPTGSNTGSTCSETAPCATFQYALSAVSGVTQINCLGSGNYGGNTSALIITKSIVIDCGTGSVGTVAPGSGNAIAIQTSSAATIVLRHLSITGSEGIDAETQFFGGTLIVEDCLIQGTGVNNHGIGFGPGAGARSLLQVSNTQIRNYGVGISITPFSPVIATATLDRVESSQNLLDGVVLGGTGVVAGVMRNSLVAGNTQDGVLAQGSAASFQAFFTIEESSIIANVGNGIHTNSANAFLNVGASTIGANGTGVKVQAGSIVSFGNNQMSDNGVNGSFASTTPLE
jgi:hypothetical protein